MKRFRSRLYKYGAGILIFIAAFGLQTNGYLPAAQTSPPVIENPEKPASPNAGRVLALKEVLRIKDDGAAFFFKEPYLNIAAAADGSVFVQDGLKLYKFGPDGRYLGNFVKAGQGPGEITTELTEFLVRGNELVLFSAPSSKLLVLSLAGKLLKEIKLSQRTFFDLVAYDGRMFFMTNLRVAEFGRKDGLQPRNNYLFLLSPDGTSAETPTVFSSEDAIKIYPGRDGRPGAISASSVTWMRRSPAVGTYFFMADAEDYLVKRVDLGTGTIVRTFRRDYRRVKNISRDKESRDRFPAFENDIHRLLIREDKLWVLTSTFDPKKGILTDVFDFEGRFLDSFYLPLFDARTGDSFSRRYMPMAIQGHDLFVVEHDADWNYTVAKYEIGESKDEPSARHLPAA
jgi:hypothetical protein